jgi:hypothetical protein
MLQLSNMEEGDVSDHKKWTSRACIACEACGGYLFYVLALPAPEINRVKGI